ncbi:MAG TPA: LCP family protein, partial [Thermomicrobiaceae bacterium]|nr:LCP family protein [Thermomicrobiaceae bacterium]
MSAADVRRAREQRPAAQDAQPLPAGSAGPTPEADSAAIEPRTPQRLNAAEIRRGRQEQSGVVPVRSLRPAPQHARPVGRPAGSIPLVPARSRRWSRKRIALIGTPLVLLVIVGVMVGNFLLSARAAYQQIFVPSAPRPVVTVNAQGTPVIVPNVTAAAEQPDWTGKQRINILLLGADTNQARKASGEPALSDTIIVASIDPVAKTVGMMSIPRDTLVPIPGVGTDKINAAFSNGELSS